MKIFLENFGGKRLKDKLYYFFDVQSHPGLQYVHYGKAQRAMAATRCRVVSRPDRETYLDCGFAFSHLFQGQLCTVRPSVFGTKNNAVSNFQTSFN